MKLRKNEYCPIHRSRFCCGREQSQQQRKLRLGVQRIEDPQHPRGYRELRSPAEMRKLLNRKVSEQGGKCAISSTWRSSVTLRRKKKEFVRGRGGRRARGG